MSVSLANPSRLNNYKRLKQSFISNIVLIDFSKIVLPFKCNSIFYYNLNIGTKYINLFLGLYMAQRSLAPHPKKKKISY